MEGTQRLERTSDFQLFSGNQPAVSQCWPSPTPGPQGCTHWWKECESSTSWPSGARGLENGSSGEQERAQTLPAQLHSLPGTGKGTVSACSSQVNPSPLPPWPASPTCTGYGGSGAIVRPTNPQALRLCTLQGVSQGLPEGIPHTPDCPCILSAARKIPRPRSRGSPGVNPRAEAQPHRTLA